MHKRASNRNAGFPNCMNAGRQSLPQIARARQNKKEAGPPSESDKTFKKAKNSNWR